MDEMNNLEQAITALENAPQSGSIEVYVDTDFVKNLPQVLNNLDKVEEWVKQQTTNDRNLVVTSENEEAVKARCAELNKLTEQIEAKRKEVKKAYQAPLTLFENKCKAVVAALQEPKNHLWAQIKAADERRKTEKRELLVAHYAEAMGDRYEYRPFEVIEKTTWLTKTAKAETVFKELDEIANSVKSDIEAIERFGGNDTAALLLEYKRGKTVTDALKFYESLKAQREQQAERQRQCEAARVRESESANEAPTAPEEEHTEQIFTVTLTFTMTKTQANELAQYLRGRRINYKRQR